ncbi:MAG: hypothetical protein Q9182_005834 [Xanthomendoza sp. 2 TL-2023]
MMAFLLSTLLLLSTYQGAFESIYGPYRKLLVDRQSHIKTSSPNNAVPSLLKSMGLAFGHRDCLVDLSPPVDNQATVELQQQSGVKHTNKRQVKAYSPAFAHHKRQGDVAYNEIMASFEGCERIVRDFKIEDFANGYSQTNWGDTLPAPVWYEEVFPKLPGAVIPTAKTSFFVEYKWDKNFINNQGEPVKTFKNWAIFQQYYIPSSSAIVVSEVNSPAFQVKQSFNLAGKPIPSSQEIADCYVPPLHRWSDVTWTIWKSKGGSGNLR